MQVAGCLVECEQAGVAEPLPEAGDVAGQAVGTAEIQAETARLDAERAATWSASANCSGTSPISPLNRHHVRMIARIPI